VCSSDLILGILLGFFGVLTIILLPVWSKPSVFNGNLLGNLLVFVGVSSFSLHTVLSKKAQADFSPLVITVYFLITTSLAQLIFLPADLKYRPDWWMHLSLQGIMGVLYVGFIGTAATYLLYQLAIKKATPVIASMILYLQPIVAIIWASVLLGEKITLGFAIGSAFAFIGISLVTKESKSRE